MQIIFNSVILKLEPICGNEFNRLPDAKGNQSGQIISGKIMFHAGKVLLVFWRRIQFYSKKVYWNVWL